MQRRCYAPAVTRKHPKIDLIRNPTLFEMDKIEQPGPVANSPLVGHRYSEPGLLLGTSAFSAAGWQGSFYPPGTNPRDFLTYYGTRFKTVEIDSTYYGTPSESTVKGWYKKTPSDFIFAAKVPQIVTHERVLLECEPEMDEFVNRMSLLNEKLGPLLLQFPHFDKYEFNGPDEFVRRLGLFLKRVKDLPTVRIVVEIRNKMWLDKRFTDVRWLGDRKRIEKVTQVWDTTVVDRQSDLKNWVDVFKQW
jgi:uncharacterized protein YecE (DUF72 family)